MTTKDFYALFSPDSETGSYYETRDGTTTRDTIISRLETMQLAGEITYCERVPRSQLTRDGLCFVRFRTTRSGLQYVCQELAKLSLEQRQKLFDALKELPATWKEPKPANTWREWDPRRDSEY